MYCQVPYTYATIECVAQITGTRSLSEINHFYRQWSGAEQEVAIQFRSMFPVSGTPYYRYTIYAFYLIKQTFTKIVKSMIHS